MKITLWAPVIVVFLVFVADRAAPGYGKFALLGGQKQLLSFINENPQCDKPMTATEFQKLKTMKGQTVAQVIKAFKGSYCPGSTIQLDFNKKQIEPIFEEGKLKALKVISL
jgi:hypothetical protein